MIVDREFTSLESTKRHHVLRIAHRGASAYAPENSLEAFGKAAELGADMVEIDIHITDDDRPVVTHDANLKRIYGIANTVDELSLKELRELTTTQTHDPVPTFEEVAFVCTALKLGIYLDIKDFNPKAFAIIFETLGIYAMSDYVIFGSFRPDWLAEIKAIKPLARTSILFSSIYVQPVQLAQSVQANYVHPCWENAAPEPHRLLTPDWLEVVRAANLGIVTWHEEREKEIKALIKLGVDGICSNAPDLLSSLAS